MNRRSALAVTTTMLLGSGLATATDNASAQQKSLKDQLVGTWTLVSAESVDSSGNKMPLVAGSNAKGLLIFTASGRLSFQVIADFSKVVSKDRMKMTPDEMKAMAQGVLSYFGAYTVNEADKSITIQIERSSFPNQTERPAKRVATIVGDELRMNNPGRLAGGQANLVWKRAQ